ncbi:hypothetical protein ACU686_00495 [Yinghuangia aomiensis]
MFSGRSGDVAGPAVNVVPITMVDATLSPMPRSPRKYPATRTGSCTS